MNRLKFRAWDKKAEIMHYYNDFKIFDMSLGFFANTHIECEPEELIIMHPTGLNAAKSYRGESDEDRAIFEGDIIIDGMERIGVAKWRNENATFISAFVNPTGIHKSTLFSANTMKVELLEIIGNIYEHSELLDGGE